MKKLNLIALLLSLSILNAFAQTKLIIVKDAESKLWGYSNENGEMVIPAKYERALEFSEDGIAVVKEQDAKFYSFINIKGEKIKTVITEFSLKSDFGIGLTMVSDIDGYYEGLIAVKTIDNKWGFLNTKGEWAIPAKYSEVKSFSEGFASVRIDEKKLIIDKKGTEIEIKSSEPIQSINKFQNGLAPFKTQNENKELQFVGFISPNGTVAIKPEYKSVGYFENAMAWVKTKDNLIGFINTNGEMIIKPQFKSIGSFVKGISWVKMPNNLVGFINTKGEMIISPKFTGAKDFEETGTIAKVNTDKIWYYINTKGETVNFNYDDKNMGDFANGLAWVKVDGKCGVINLKGELVVKPSYDAIRTFHNGYAGVKIGKEWGLINVNGKLIFPAKYIDIKDLEIIK